MGEIVAEISIVVNARSDTTATATNKRMYSLKKLTCMTEVRQAIEAAPDLDDKCLPYLKACLDEFLRIIPTTFDSQKDSTRGRNDLLGVHTR